MNIATKVMKIIEFLGLYSVVQGWHYCSGDKYENTITLTRYNVMEKPEEKMQTQLSYGKGSYAVGGIVTSS